MKIDQILKKIEIVETFGKCDREIENICFDSRKCRSGSLFVAISGTKYDGHDYIGSAIDAGATAIIYESGDYKPNTNNAGALFIRVNNSRIALGIAASNFYHNPSSKLKIVGITGTNGKTTTVTLLYRVFMKLGYKCGLLSTIENYSGARRFEATHTTPDPIYLNELLSEMVHDGCEYCFMEVSSHSSDQDRIAGIEFIGGIFSNITHDHLDYHKTFQSYIEAKKKFFDNLSKNAFALTNIDDKNGLVMLQNCKATIRKYSCRSKADFNCRVIEKTMDGMMINIDGREVWTKFIGEHNAYNILAVYGTSVMLGADKTEILTAISSMESVSGRLEYVKGGNNITAVIDYAHTPDALENVLKTMREYSPDNELICLFGCGGNKDTSKRPEMGEVAAKYADRLIVTSDNPRMEDPDTIIENIRSGIPQKDLAKSLFITNRREAIRTAIITAKPNSIILIAGKGHEDYQEIQGVRQHFNDKEIAMEILNTNR